jgi:hypothetical protein
MSVRELSGVYAGRTPKSVPLRPTSRRRQSPECIAIGAPIVTAYPDFHNDLPGLTLAGKKVWRIGKLLQQFGAVRLSLTAPQMSACVDEVRIAVAETAPAVRRHAEAYSEFREIGKRMLTEWECGVLDISPNVTAAARAGTQLRASVGHAGGLG